MIRTYHGSVAVITGGASGIGRALGIVLARRGAREIVIADLQTQLAEKTANDIRDSGARARVVPLDVRDGEKVQALFDDVAETSGRIDYVFNNAGTGVMGETHRLEGRDWELMLDINIGGVINVIRASYPKLLTQGYGHLVNTASTAGLITTPFMSMYSATKHAVVGLSKAMRIEAAPHGVRVTALCPGVVDTPLLTGGAVGRSVFEMTDERRNAWWKRFRPAEVGRFAEQVLDHVAKNEGVIILPKHNAAAVALFRAFPALEETIIARLHAKWLSAFPEMHGSAPRGDSTSDRSRRSP